MKIRRSIAVIALATPCLAATVAGPAAHAESPVSPPEETTFVSLACGFPVLWDFSSGFHEIEAPFGIIDVSPQWSIMLTNLDTGKVWQQHGDGTFSVRERADGSALLTSNGVNFVTGRTALIGHFTATVSPDGEQSDWVGNGTVVDICAALS